MAVLIEGISVVILCQSIIKKVSGGVAEFISLIPNRTLCSDGELACVSFMTPIDTRNFVEALNRVGLRYRGSDGAAIDIVVVDQQSGPVVSCEGVDFGHTDWNNDPSQVVAVCCARRTKNTGIVAPEGWSYGRSLTANSKYISGDKIPSNLEFVAHEDGVDVFRDTESGQNFYVRR